MASASKKHQQASNFGFGTDNYLPLQNERSDQRAVKPSAVTIHARINGVQDSYLQDRSFGQGVQRISGRWIETGLQVKIQNRPGGDSNRRNGRTLAMCGTRKQTDEAQKRKGVTMHELGLSSPREEKRE